MRGFARVCRVEDSKVNALSRAIGVRGLEKSPRPLKADAVDPVLCRPVSPAAVPAAGVIVPQPCPASRCNNENVFPKFWRENGCVWPRVGKHGSMPSEPAQEACALESFVTPGASEGTISFGGAQPSLSGSPPRQRNGADDLATEIFSGPPPIGKNVHEKLVDEGFMIFFNEPVDPTSAGNTGNYTVLTITKHGKKTITTPVAIRSALYGASPDGSESAVTIRTSKQTFAHGGELEVNGAPPSGIANSTETLFLTGNTTFTISPNAKHINPS